MDRSSARGSCPAFLRAVAFAFLVLAGVAASTSSIYDAALELHSSTGRSLLQAPTPCPINFEFKNYTIITSQCQRPYPPKLCCGAFKEFACPYIDQLNDLANDCSTVMFNYITLKGNYPPGLFSSLCRDTKDGLLCPAAPPTQSDPIPSAATVAHGDLPLVVLGMLLLFTFMFI